MNVEFKLSYQMPTVAWDGKVIRKLPDAEISGWLDLMRRCGVDEVMLSGYHLEEDSDFDVDRETRRLGAELASRGMRAAQHHGLSATYAPLGTSQREAVEHICRGVDFTANLGAKALVLHSGRITGRFVGTEPYLDIFKRECAAHGRKRVLEQCAENLRAAGDYAAKQGVLIAMENLDRFEPLGSPEELPQLIALADSPAVGYCLDSGHAHCAGSDLLKWIEVMGDKLFTTHFHDNHGPSAAVLNSTGLVAPHGIDEHLPPGFGTISWIDVIVALVKSDYSRSVNFESGAWPEMELEVGLKAAISYWRVSERLAARKLAKEE